MSALAPVLTALYVPGDRPDRFEKAVASGADIVVVDLEDAVAAGAKADARDAVVTWLCGRRPTTSPPHGIQVRINAVTTTWCAADMAALSRCPTLRGVRIPKAESGSDLGTVRAALGHSVELHPIVETARGVEALRELANHPGVASLGLGEADLAADLGIDGDAGLSWVRSRLVVAARAAGLPAPMMSVWASTTDLEGLASSCAGGRSLGFLGRSAIHPRQLPVIVAALRPRQQDLHDAQAVIDTMAAATAAGRGVATLPSGAMVDAAMLPAAERVLRLEAAAAAALTAMTGSR